MKFGCFLQVCSTGTKIVFDLGGIPLGELRTCMVNMWLDFRAQAVMHVNRIGAIASLCFGRFVRQGSTPSNLHRWRSSGVYEHQAAC